MNEVQKTTVNEENQSRAVTLGTKAWATGGTRPSGERN